MAATIQSLAASSSLSSPTSFDSKRFRASIPGRKVGLLFVRSDLRASHGPTPNRKKLESPAATPASAKTGHEVLLFEALREGLDEEMQRDLRVCVMGEDVGHYGGSYEVTKGLATKYGDLRVLDTPIAENSFTGMGIGAAMTGLRPRLESYFQSIPGIQMVACSTPYNAKGLMKAAIRSENPVILFEHVLLYNLKERIPDEEYVLSLEEAEMVRPGEHVTILTYSRMRYHVMQAAKTLVNKGYDPEVIDIRSLKPFDLYTIGNSVKKTHRVLTVEECMRTGGIGASLTAAINENFHDYLDAPIMCLSSQDVPTPYAGTLEKWTVVQPAQIVTAVEQLCR
ncbi:hypothetical protein Cgig2_013323 [Carnegiea gigantea]|uniref:pyruvate dehydrogenase (acetyl-transferring) n=1 Tax=Carnegiea gigantea TaxID=171969 RepID=A0A9Q1GR19_9CARY|nr:hypothetical protein Cgig2_013323 [Carnegiea gigantea]